jgi:hypothetical protein
MNDMMPAACSGVVAVTAIDQQDGSINNTQNAAERFTNFLNLDTSPGASNPPTPFKANMTVAAPGGGHGQWAVAHSFYKRSKIRPVSAFRVSLECAPTFMHLIPQHLGRRETTTSGALRTYVFCQQEAFSLPCAGERIWSTCYQQNAPYCTRSGTSQATPHVTGMMARCFSGGRCQAAGNGTTSVWYAVNKWMEYNLDHFEYGYSKDPIRQPRGNIFYFGYLTVADVW